MFGRPNRDGESDPGPFGQGPPGHPRFAGRGPFGRGRGARRSRGDVRIATLALLSEQPMHGYQVIQEIRQRTGRAWTPSPGSIYPTLSQLAAEGLVRSEQSNGRSVVHLTEQGRQHVEQHRDELDAVWNSTTADASEVADLRTADATSWARLPRLPTSGHLSSSQRPPACSTTPAAASTCCWQRLAVARDRQRSTIDRLTRILGDVDKAGLVPERAAGTRRVRLGASTRRRTRRCQQTSCQ